MTDRKQIIILGLFIIISVLSAVMRFDALALPPAGEVESEYLLSAWDLINKAGIAPVISTVYANITGLLFWLFGSSQMLGRIIPALAGFLIPVLVFLLLRKKHPVFALILSTLLAISPVLLFNSREAGGAILSISLMILTVVFFYFGKGNWAAAMFALALLSGKEIWLGIFSLLIVFFLIWLLERRSMDQSFFQDVKKYFDIENLRSFGFVFIITFLAAGTMLWIFPSSITGVFNSLVLFFKDFSQSGTFSPLNFIIGASIQEILLFVLAIVGMVDGIIHKNKWTSYVSIWWMILLIVLLIMPGRNTGYMVWFTAAQIILSSVVLHKLVKSYEEDYKISLAATIIIAVLFGFILYNTAGLFCNKLLEYQQTYAPEVAQNFQFERWAKIAGAALITLVITISAGLGYSWKFVKNGLLSGSFVVLFVLTLSSSWHTRQADEFPFTENLREDAYFSDQHLLKETIAEYSTWSIGNPVESQILVENLDIPSIRWTLIDQENVDWVLKVGNDQLPPMILSKDVSNRTITSSYTGQDFVLEKTIDWENLSAWQFIHWYFYYDLPSEDSEIILWVRSDLFPGYDPEINVVE